MLKVEQSEVIEVVTQLQTQLEQLEVDLPGDDTFASLHQLINRKPDRKEMKRWLDTVLAAASKTTKRKRSPSPAVATVPGDLSRCARWAALRARISSRCNG